jgi:hypothetical protein
MSLISHDLATMPLPMTKDNKSTFVTAGGMFTADCVLKIENEMLAHLSTNKTFTTKFMVIPTQDDNNYGKNLGQDLMQQHKHSRQHYLAG